MVSATIVNEAIANSESPLIRDIYHVLLSRESNKKDAQEQHHWHDAQRHENSNKSLHANKSQLEQPRVGCLREPTAAIGCSSKNA